MIKTRLIKVKSIENEEIITMAMAMAMTKIIITTVITKIITIIIMMIRRLKISN